MQNHQADFVTRVHDALTSDRYACPQPGCGGSIRARFVRVDGEDDWVPIESCPNGCDQQSGYRGLRIWIALTAVSLERLRLWEQLFPGVAFHQPEARRGAE